MSAFDMLHELEWPFTYLAFPAPGEKGRPKHPYLRFKVHLVISELVYRTFNKAGIAKAQDNEPFNFSWGAQYNEAEYRSIKSHQKINHFAGAFFLGRKDNLQKIMNKLALTNRARFFPRSYLMPDDFAAFIGETAPSSTWIYKPAAAARGNGISIIRKDEDPVDLSPGILQEYLANPLLIDGHKFDLRLYVLVTSVSPLKLYIYDSGLVRIAPSVYAAESYKDLSVHLTNFSLSQDASLKLLLPELVEQLEGRGIHWATVWERITELVVTTVLAGAESIKPYHNKHVCTPYTSFELFGFDILLDTDLEPHLLEVNISPSLTAYKGDKDFELKASMLSEAMNIARVIDCDPSKGSPTFDRFLAELSASVTKERAGAISSGASAWDAPTFADLVLVRDYLEENHLAQHFQLIHPVPSSLSLARSFPSKYADVVISQWISLGEASRLTALTRGIEAFRSSIERISNDHKFREGGRPWTSS